MRIARVCTLLLIVCLQVPGARKADGKKPAPTLDDYIREAETRAVKAEAGAGSLYKNERPAREPLPRFAGHASR